MREDLVFNTRRFTFVYLTCEYLYYDNEEKKFCCADRGITFDKIIRCKRCRKGELIPVLSENEIVSVDDAQVL